MSSSQPQQVNHNMLCVKHDTIPVRIMTNNCSLLRTKVGLIFTTTFYTDPLLLDSITRRRNISISTPITTERPISEQPELCEQPLHHSYPVRDIHTSTTHRDPPTTILSKGAINKQSWRTILKSYKK